MGGWIRRSPLLAAAVTVVLMALYAAERSRFPGHQQHGWVVPVALVLMAHAVVSDLVLVPRVIIRAQRRGGRETHSDKEALFRWSFAVVPFLWGIGAVAVGQRPWLMWLGFAISLVLLLPTALTIRSGEPR